MFAIFFNQVSFSCSCKNYTYKLFSSVLWKWLTEVESYNFYPRYLKKKIFGELNYFQIKTLSIYYHDLIIHHLEDVHFLFKPYGNLFEMRQFFTFTPIFPLDKLLLYGFIFISNIYNKVKSIRPPRIRERILFFSLASCILSIPVKVVVVSAILAFYPISVIKP